MPYADLSQSNHYNDVSTPLHFSDFGCILYSRMAIEPRSNHSSLQRNSVGTPLGGSIAILHVFWQQQRQSSRQLHLSICFVSQFASSLNLQCAYPSNHTIAELMTQSPPNNLVSTRRPHSTQVIQTLRRWLLLTCLLIALSTPNTATAAGWNSGSEQRLGCGCRGVYHTVRPGQTIHAIAAQYRTTPLRILRCNGLSAYIVYTGQSLLVPPACS